MNQFEKDVQSKRNDFVDSVMGMTYSFGFFTIIFFIAVIIKALAE